MEDHAEAGETLRILIVLFTLALLGSLLSGGQPLHRRSTVITELPRRCSSCVGTVPAERCGAGLRRLGPRAQPELRRRRDRLGHVAAPPDRLSWYELVPDTSHSARITVAAGDRIHASVAVSGTRTTMIIKNLTRGTSFTNTLRVRRGRELGGRRFADARGNGSGVGTGEATTGALDPTGVSFAVTYAGAGGGTVSGSDPAGTGQGPWGTPRR